MRLRHIVIPALLLAAAAGTVYLGFGAPETNPSATSPSGGRPAGGDETAGAANGLVTGESAWQVSCRPAPGGALGCSMVKRLVLTETGRLLGQAEVFPGDAGYGMRIVAPHGLSLPQGVSLAVDGRELVRAPFFTSLPAGSVAVFDLPGPAVDEMRGGTVLSVRALQNNGADFEIRMGLAGFGAGLDKLR